MGLSSIFFSRCGKVETVYKSQGKEYKNFLRDCTTKDTCDAKEDFFLKACKAGSGSTCEINCCNGDLCNAGSTPVLSAVLVFTCALVALFRAFPIEHYKNRDHE